MFKFLFVAFFFFLLLMFLLGFSVVRTLKNILFGSGDAQKGKQRRQAASSGRQQTNRSDKRPDTASRKKIIGKDEGEYVDFEEIKK